MILQLTGPRPLSAPSTVATVYEPSILRTRRTTPTPLHHPDSLPFLRHVFLDAYVGHSLGDVCAGHGLFSNSIVTPALHIRRAPLILPCLWPATLVHRNVVFHHNDPQLTCVAECSLTRHDLVTGPLLIDEVEKLIHVQIVLECHVGNAVPGHVFFFADDEGVETEGTFLLALFVVAMVGYVAAGVGKGKERTAYPLHEGDECAFEDLLELGVGEVFAPREEGHQGVDHVGVGGGGAVVVHGGNESVGVLRATLLKDGVERKLQQRRWEILRLQPTGHCAPTGASGGAS
jgi:hypothetical protein